MPIKFYTTVAKYEPTPLPFDLTEPFYVALLDGATSATVTLTAKGDEMMGEEPPVLTVETSTDKTNWTTLGNTYVNCNFAISLSTAQPKVYIRAVWQHSYQYTQWKAGMSAVNYFTGDRVKIGGNIASLAYGSHFTGYENTIPYSCFGQTFQFWNGATIDKLILPMDGSEFAYESMFDYITFNNADTIAYVLSGTGQNTVDTGFTPISNVPYGTTVTAYIPRGLTTVYQSYYGSNDTLIEYDRPTGA